MSSQLSVLAAKEAYEALAAMVRNFDKDSIGYGRQIREMAVRWREAFCAGAIQVLANQEVSRGAQFLVTTLARYDLLLPALCDPSLTQDEAIALARSAMHAGEMVDIALARHLANRALTLGDSVCPPEMQRIMEVLSEISDGTRIIRCIKSLVHQSNPYLQSKAVLMIGRINRNIKWVLNRLTDTDPRVRANAVEALWGVDTDEVRSALRVAARDKNNRVAGNALIALYQLGDCWAIPEITAMASHESAPFRSTAAWVMGKTGDSRFSRVLARLIGEPIPAVRSRAFAALSQIKAAAAQSRQGNEWTVVARSQASPSGVRREINVTVCSKDGLEQVELLPTQFILTEGAHSVTNYSTEGRKAPGALAVAFLYPRCAEPASAPFNQGALEALQWKGPSDLWAAVPYLGVADRLGQVTLLEQKIVIPADWTAPSEDLPLQFSCDAGLAEKAFLKVPPKMDCEDLWSTIRRAVQLKNGPARGQRHLIVYSEREDGEPAGYKELASAAMVSQTSMHAILLDPNPALSRLCQTTQGTCQIAASPAEVRSCVEQACLSLTARYAICYQPVNAGSSNLAIKVQSPDGWGETTIPI